MNTINWDEVEWDTIDEQKAKFIYEDCFGLYAEIQEQISKAKHKAYVLISVLFPIIVGISGFVLRDVFSAQLWLNWHIYFLCLSAVLYILMSVLCYFAIRSSSLPALHSSPQVYFKDTKFYTQSMRKMYCDFIEQLESTICNGTQELAKIAKTTDKIFYITLASPVISTLLFLFVKLLVRLSIY